MKKKYLLPTLKEEPRLINDDFWEEIDDIYDFLLNNMKLYYETSESVFDEGSNAMPHIFEQMLLFHRIFFDKKNPEHDRAIMEWRAVLSILALQRIRNVRVEAVKVELSENSNNPFLRAAASFRPEDAPVFYQTTWDYLYIFCMSGVPIAISSPLTVVCPAKMFKKRIAKLDWLSIENVNQNSRLLFDFRGQGNEFADLGFWLKLLNSNLICVDSGDGEIFLRCEKVKEELNAFIQSYSREADLEVETHYKKKIYESMNNNIRKEYEFLNNCCDFYLADKRMNFLIERYRDDIFQQKLLVVVYDDKPDAMFYSGNLEKMEGLFHYVLEIDHRRIISVMEPGGEQLPAYALLPFKRDFVQELIDKRIMAEAFFEEYLVIYDHVRDVLEVRLSIKGFPYSFYKIYSHDDWQLLYGKEFVVTHLWPERRINSLDWKRYYTWVYQASSEVKVDIPYAVSSVDYQREGENGFRERDFQLIRTESFPPYIRYSYGMVSGYLPIRTKSAGMKDVGGTIGVFVDIGHTSTYVTMLKLYDESTGKNTERIAFRVPGSVKITGGRKENLQVNSSFVMSEEECRKKEVSYFRNAIHSFYSYKKTPYTYSVSPFEDGQTLFHKESCLELLGDDTLHFLNFDYAQMRQQQKRHAHIFVEQILLFAIHTALLKQGSYIKIYFIHEYDDEKEKIGELEGLWKHALQIGKKWTGISESFHGSIHYISEQNALIGNLYRNLISWDESIEKLLSCKSNKIFAGVDIGWKKTLLTYIYKDEEEDRLQAKYARSAFGGYDISLIDSEYEFRQYDEMLSIFLTGSRKTDENSIEGRMLREIRGMYQKETKQCDSYYHGIFDLIAMQIEKNNYTIPLDVYNNMDEFYSFMKMMTYNILLLFLNIGYILGRMYGKSLKENSSEIHIFLGGNGAKFLRWVSNIKDYDCIDESNNDRIFIVGMNGYGILDVLKKGFFIVDEKNKNKKLMVVIHLEHEMKEEMVNGYIFQETPNFYNYSGTLSSLEPENVENCFQVSEDEQQMPAEKQAAASSNDNTDDKQKFYNEMGELRKKIFYSEDKKYMNQGQNFQEITDISQIIRANSHAVCKEIIHAINNMKDNDES